MCHSNSQVFPRGAMGWGVYGVLGHHVTLKIQREPASARRTVGPGHGLGPAPCGLLAHFTGGWQTSRALRRPEQQLEEAVGMD